MATAIFKNAHLGEPDLTVEINNYRKGANTVSFRIPTGIAVAGGSHIAATEIRKADIPALVSKLMSVYE